MDNKIDQVMNERNITAADLAKMVGIKQRYINRIIYRKNAPSVRLQIRIAKALGVPMQDLFVKEH